MYVSFLRQASSRHGDGKSPCRRQPEFLTGFWTDAIADAKKKKKKKNIFVIFAPAVLHNLILLPLHSDQ